MVNIETKPIGINEIKIKPDSLRNPKNPIWMRSRLIKNDKKAIRAMGSFLKIGVSLLYLREITSTPIIIGNKKRVSGIHPCWVLSGLMKSRIIQTHMFSGKSVLLIAKRDSSHATTAGPSIKESLISK
ncbi:MAG: hypothetical protein R2827_06295 [Bdellovibrionales bacterium]